jgi:hypothetical protein
MHPGEHRHGKKITGKSELSWYCSPTAVLVETANVVEEMGLEMMTAADDGERRTLPQCHSGQIQDNP